MRAPLGNHLFNNGRNKVKNYLIALMLQMAWLQMALRKSSKTLKAIADLLHQSKVIY